jgi:hypothetical protein
VSDWGIALAVDARMFDNLRLVCNRELVISPSLHHSYSFVSRGWSSSGKPYGSFSHRIAKIWELRCVSYRWVLN